MPNDPAAPVAGGPAITRRLLLAGAAAFAVPAIGTCSTPLAPIDLPPPNGTLRARAERKGLVIGTTFGLEQFDDARMIAAIRRDYNSLVPDNGLNWTRTQGKPGAPLYFGQVERVYALTQAMGAQFRLHNLVYDNTMPDWVRALVPTLAPAAAANLLTDYIARVLAVWGDRASQIVVVNEPMVDFSGGPDPALFARKLGPHYIDLAFRSARAAAPGAALYVNSAILEHDEPVFDRFRAGMLRLIEGMLQRGVPIDGLGVESHLEADRRFTPRVVADFFQEVADLGLDIMVTELDVNDRGIAGDSAARDAGVAALTKAYLDAALSVRACRGVVTWNETDRYTWLRAPSESKRFRADGQPIRPTPLDDGYRRKPMWSAIAAALDAAPARGSQARA